MDYDKWRDELLAIPVTNLDAVHAAYQKVMELPRGQRHTAAAELCRWAEWALGRAVYEAQRRGEVASSQHINATPVTRYLAKNTTAADTCRQFQPYSQEHMAEAIKRTRDKGSLSVTNVYAELRQLPVTYQPLKEVGLSIKPTKRGERLVREMALTLNSLATATQGVHPLEVDAAALAEVLKQARSNAATVEWFLEKVSANG